MTLIDILIQSTALLSLVYLTAEFIRFCFRHQPAAHAKPELAKPTSQQPQFNHVVVPFTRRPATRREPSNRELIQLAKLYRDRFPQAAKWSFQRKLSKPVRSELLELWREVAA